MGAGASVEAEGAATKDEVVAFAGDAFDAGAWDAAAKDGAGRVAWADVAAHVKTSAIEGTTEGGYVYGAAARRASVSAAMELIETEKSSEEVLDALAPTPGMDRAARLFHALATHVSTVSETLGSGFGASYTGAHVNYARLFKACDVDAAGMMDKQELILTLRTTLKLKKKVMTDGDIGFLFDMIDGDGSGVVTMAEFNMFAKGIAPTSDAVGAKPPRKLQHSATTGALRAAPPKHLDRSASAGELARLERSKAGDMHRAQVQTVQTKTSKQQEYSAVPLACGPSVPKLEGRLKKGLKVPKDMSDHHLLLWFLGQHIASAANKNNKLVNPGKINYFKCFQIFDLDGSSGISRDEFAKTVRRTLGVTSNEISHAALDTIFREMDDDGSGVISVKEFSAYMRGSTNAQQARATASPADAVFGVARSVRRASQSLGRATPKSGRKSVNGRSDLERRSVNNRSKMGRGGPPVAVPQILRHAEPKKKQVEVTPTSWLDDLQKKLDKGPAAPPRHVTCANATIENIKKELDAHHNT